MTAPQAGGAAPGVRAPGAPRVALVTGGARGIGAAVALRLAQDGHDVAVLDLDESACADSVAAVQATGRRGLAVGADVADEPAVTTAVERVTAELGPPLVLVNNAGILRDHVLSKMTADEWALVVQVHLRGAFLMCRAVQPAMRQAAWGRMVNLSSTAALGNVGQANYSAAKAGLQGLTRTLALELGRHGITVNSVAPGYTITDMTRSTAQRIGVSIEELTREVVATIPVGRAGQPEDIAHAVAWFCDERSGFVTGQVLYVAGGPRG
ncbi:MAG: 3-oxoacyl-ACP reductase FabG [Actinomycetota bacterium]|nr:3-oxoacyl-ACP reductase FabG [Actinomycetota bacterium]